MSEWITHFIYNKICTSTNLQNIYSSQSHKPRKQVIVEERKQAISHLVHPNVNHEKWNIHLMILEKAFKFMIQTDVYISCLGELRSFFRRFSFYLFWLVFDFATIANTITSTVLHLIFRRSTAFFVATNAMTMCSRANSSLFIMRCVESITKAPSPA